MKLLVSTGDYDLSTGWQATRGPKAAAARITGRPKEKAADGAPGPSSYVQEATAASFVGEFCSPLAVRGEGLSRQLFTTFVLSGTLPPRYADAAQASSGGMASKPIQRRLTRTERLRAAARQVLSRVRGLAMPPSNVLLVCWQALSRAAAVSHPPGRPETKTTQGDLLRKGNAVAVVTAAGSEDGEEKGLHNPPSGSSKHAPELGIFRFGSSMSTDR